MAGPTQEEIETFMSITGVPEATAIQKLEEHGGNLNEAVNGYFTEEDRNIMHEPAVAPPEDNSMDIDDTFQTETFGDPLSHLAAGTSNPFSLLDPGFTRRVISSGFDFTSREPFVSHPREVREIPIEVKDGIDRAGQSGGGPTIEEVTGSVHANGPEILGTVTIDDDDVEEVRTAPIARAPTGHIRPSAPGIDELPDYSNDIEEEMLRAAIEASKRDAETSNKQLDNHSESTFQQKRFDAEDPEIAHAVSLSLKTAEQEKALRQLEGRVGRTQRETNKLADEEQLRKMVSANGRLEAGSSSVQEEQPLIWQRRRHTSPNSIELAKGIDEVIVSPPASPRLANNHSQENERDFHSYVWGAISSEEHDEAVMLEAAMFGGIPEGSSYHITYAPHQFMQGGIDASMGPYSRQVPRPPSPSFTAQRLLREQQDDEYFASLQADREKELRAKEEEEAALVEQRRKEEELRRKLDVEQDIERQLAAKEASLPPEPPLDDENAVTLLVRMPDGSRRGRRFLKSDKLQCLFDFIDVGRVVKPGTYKVVIPYPRLAFSDGESALTLTELGLTSKQEALFLELI